MTAATGRGYAKGRAKQAEIIGQAVALFGEVGYRGASLRELAARCGLTHPGLLYHFPTKQALLLAVLADRDRVDGELLLADGVVGLARLRRVVDVVARNAERRVIVEMFSALSAEATSTEHPAHGYFVERYRRALATTVADYEHAAAAGVLRPGTDPAEAGRQLIALMDGLQVQWLFDPATDMARGPGAHPGPVDRAALSDAVPPPAGHGAGAVTLATKAATLAAVRAIFSSRVSDSGMREPMPASLRPRR